MVTATDPARGSGKAPVAVATGMVDCEAVVVEDDAPVDGPPPAVADGIANDCTDEVTTAPLPPNTYTWSPRMAPAASRMAAVRLPTWCSTPVVVFMRKAPYAELPSVKPPPTMRSWPAGPGRTRARVMGTGNGAFHGAMALCTDGGGTGLAVVGGVGGLVVVVVWCPPRSFDGPDSSTPATIAPATTIMANRGSHQRRELRR
jgi:hypothetical protein